MIKEFAIKHMKSSQIKIDQELNRYIWEKGKTNPPRKVRVRIVRDDDDQVIVSLYEDIVVDNEAREKSIDKKEEGNENNLEESESATSAKGKTSDNEENSKA
jgi:large subunit ribosomal protein L31e